MSKDVEGTRFKLREAIQQARKQSAATLPTCAIVNEVHEKKSDRVACVVDSYHRCYY